MAHVSPGVLITMALVSAAKQTQGHEDKPENRDIAALLVKVKKEGIDIGDISLRGTPGGYYSDSIEQLTGQFLHSGYASQNSPFRFTDEGWEVSKEIILDALEDDPDEVKRIAESLNINLASL